MEDANAWELELEHILRLHESQIGNELSVISELFDISAASQDINFMSNLFDYLRYRLIATCKKIEVNYFTRKSIQLLSSHYECGAMKIVDEKWNDVKSENDTLIDETDEELHGEWELVPLKIVEESDLNGKFIGRLNGDKLNGYDFGADAELSMDSRKFVSCSEINSNL